MAHNLADGFTGAEASSSSAVPESVRYLHPELQNVTEVDPRLLHMPQVAQGAGHHISIVTGSQHQEQQPAAGSQDAFQQPGDEEIRDQDRFLPIANVARVMKKQIPANGKISKEAKECMQECVSEFISFLTSEACDRCQNERRKTITGEDILFSMQVLGFDSYIEPLKAFLIAYRETVRGTTGRLDMPYEGQDGVATATTGADSASAGVAGAAGGAAAESYMAMANYQYATSDGGDDEYIDVTGHAGLHATAGMEDTDALAGPLGDSTVAFQRRPSDETEYRMVPSSEMTALPPSSFG